MLHNKVVLITGGSGGLGTVVTQSFVDAGAAVVDAGRYSNAKSASAIVTSLIQTHQRIDALVHLIGGFAGGTSVAETNEETLQRMFDLNFNLAFHMVRAVIPHMRRQQSGRILAVGSRAAVEPAPMAAAYAASKAALVSLIRSIASENSDAHISANIVLPDTMDTPANRAANPSADPTRWVQPRQVAALLTHLVSADAGQVNGAVIPIYG